MHKGGIGAMELVAMHMKGTGQYLARSLSFKDASFEIVEVKLTGMSCVQKSAVAEIISERPNVELSAHIAQTLTDEFKDMYDKSVEVWQNLISRPDWWTRPSEHGARLLVIPVVNCTFPLLTRNSLSREYLWLIFLQHGLF